ncbi:MAG: hypothetical protein ACOX5Z_05480 [Desulfobulbus sp.]|jgi:hypothetical protein
MTLSPNRFIYIVGEHQSGMIAESAEVLAFTQDSMQQIETDELALVIANVFSRGQSFLGPESALMTVIHEFVRRSDRYVTQSRSTPHRCTLVTAFKRLKGEDIAVEVAAVIDIAARSLSLDDPEGFHKLVLETLPSYQEVFVEKAYAPDSKLIEIIKETTMYHIQKKLQ